MKFRFDFGVGDLRQLRGFCFYGYGRLCPWLRPGCLGGFFFVLSFWNQRLVLPLPLSCGIPCFLWREKAEVLNDLEA